MWPLYLVVVLSLVAAQHTQHHYNNVLNEGYIHQISKSSQLFRIIEFLRSVQNPKSSMSNTTTVQKYGKIKIGIYAGFAAQFQMAAAEWMRALAAVNFSMPILIQGEITGYSNNPACETEKYQYTCYFYPSSDDQENIIKTGVEVPVNVGGFDPSLMSYIPPLFKEQGASYWWAAIQYYLFRLKPNVMRHVLAQGQKMRHGLGFPYNLQHFIAGIHIRHGDKKQDGFREHQLSEELSIIRKCKSICQVEHDYKDLDNHDDFQCFSRINTKSNVNNVHSHNSYNYIDNYQTQDIVPSNHTATAHSLNANSGNHAHMQRVMRNKIDVFYQDDLTSYIDFYQNNKYSQPMAARNSSDRLFDTSRYDQYTYRSLNTNHSDTILSPKLSNYYHNYHLNKSNNNLLFPLQIFIASDDKSVIQMAHHHNYLVLNEGISHNTGSTGMLVTLVQDSKNQKKDNSIDKNKGYNATLEVISDIFYLSHCSILVGICASQVYRMAVALSNVSGLLQCASTLDTDQIRMVKRLSDKYSVPFPENFYD